MHDARVLPAPPALLSRHAPELAERGFYLTMRPDGFDLHMNAGPERLCEMRARVFREVCGSAAGELVADAARLVASELVGNAIRLCGPWVPVVVQVTISPDQVLVRVHDPEPAVVPQRRPRPPGNDTSESGRGLWILDLLAPGWTVQSTPVGKQISCRLPYGGSNCA